MYTNEFSQEFEQAIGQEQGYGSSQETFEFNPEFMGEMEAEGFGLNESQEMEMAHELLEVSNEQELNMFLGKLVKSAGRAVSSFARSPIGQSLGGVLKTVAKQALPMVAGAAGSFVGGPLGGMIGSKLGSVASNLFELELEGLSPEDQEFETARAFVRFANAAAANAATAATAGQSPQAAVRTALTEAAREHAPGLLRPQSSNSNGQATTGLVRNGQAPSHRPRATQGTWTRQGRTLIIQL